MGIRKYKILLFDLDGTLTNSFEGIANAIDYSYSRFGKSILRSEMYRYIGPPLTKSFAEDFDTEEEMWNAIRIFREYYVTKGVYENKPYDGIAELLKRLKDDGFHIATATSKQYFMAEEVVRYFGLDKYIDDVFAADERKNRNNKADIVQYAIDTLKADKKDVVLIGDTDYDIEGAKKVGINNIIVGWGFGEKGIDKRADSYVRSVDELYRLLAGTV